MHGIVQAHAFVDGNKRASWLATDTFLRLNGLRIKPMSKDAASEYMNQVTRHVHSELDTAFWLAQNSITV